MDWKILTLAISVFCVACKLAGSENNEEKQSDHTVKKGVIQDSDKSQASQTGIHENFNQLLKSHVADNGWVDYKGLKDNRGTLDEYLQFLKSSEPNDSWSREKAMAYWINLYNASTLQLIVDNYPLKSIMELDAGKVWDRKWIKVGNYTYSLNEIEHSVLREKYEDPRIHFAVNCAATSCPKLWNNAWTENNLEESLNALTRDFVNNEKYNQISSNNLQLSRIFDWYRQDFGDLTAFIDRYSKADISSKAKISFNEYDWSLNGQ